VNAPDVDRLQAELLTAFLDGRGDAAAVARDHAPDPVIVAWVEAWDPDLVALAGELTRTWGRRTA
jgi:hypothetical protein